MEEEHQRVVTDLLSSHAPDELLRGLALIKDATPHATPVDAQQYCELILPLFYIDPLDHPEHVPAIEEAIMVAAGLGESVIPILIQSLEAGDVKAQMAMAQALGWMGAKAVDPLITEYEGTCPDPACRAFLLYALGKVKAPEIIKAAPLALEAAASPDLELRDTATRAIGKFAESIPASELKAGLRNDLVERLRKNLADTSPGIRAKAVRSLGKLAKHGHLTQDQRGQLRRTLLHLTGDDGRFEWDRAFVVRKEAKEALEYV
jgi:HEAT repeat protein